MKSIKLWLIVIVLIVTVGLQLVLPNLFAERIATSLKQELNSWQQLEVEIDAVPALKLLLGQADELELEGKELVLNRIKISSIEAKYKDLKVKETNQGWQMVKGKNTYLDLELTEQNLNDYLLTRSELRVFEDFKVDITSNQVLITGVIVFFDAQVNLQLAGNFKVINSQQIVFRSDKLAVENIVIPSGVIKELKNQLQFKIDLTKLPIPVIVKQVKLKQDGLEILGINN
ncbi:Protein of unknown function (DUF2993) [Halobacteroides halobius DSM 5150]|uniref:DUF2993 domain-containing protein n=1 Tax=Halobacteroides halobius (strain ATCC 35273 / DSM 5150 / MD-1) TaxID=748449 RepID=L0KDD1_HALHC|nr:DUF2993 domain-containing protein [Halobacteroides halobius]AGB42103.1 Protein of unknown function (DUF2993) [Halobacteroides halobius DSM 5150]